MQLELAVTLISILIGAASTLYYREQARSAKDQVAEAREANRQAEEANRLMAEQLALMQAERDAAARVTFRFQPRRDNGMNFLDLVNDAPHDTYVLWARLSGPEVDTTLRGKRISHLERLGGHNFVAAREKIQILDLAGPTGWFSHPNIMADGSTAQLVLCLKTDGVIYEVRTDLRFESSRGFSTHGTTITPA